MPPSLDRHAAPPRKLRIWAARAHRYLGLALLAFLLIAWNERRKVIATRRRSGRKRLSA
mgnify:CR=1 FL=1